MKVKMLVHGSGPDGAVKPGSEVVVSDEHGAELVAAGYAEEIPEPPAEEETPDAETAPQDVPETKTEAPAAEDSPEPETRKKAPRKRRQTAKSAS